MDGAEGAGSFNEFYQLVVVTATNHWARKGPEAAERKVRGEPDGWGQELRRRRQKRKARLRQEKTI